MQELQAKLEKAQSQEKESGPAEDMNALRQILENLIDLSLSEEDLLKRLAETNKNDPTYVSLILQQNKLSDDSRVLEDSLYALSKRQVQVKATINREMRSISSNFTKSLDNMAERQTESSNPATTHNDLRKQFSLNVKRRFTGYARRPSK